MDIPKTKDDLVRGFEERNRLIMKAAEMVDEGRRVGIGEGLQKFARRVVLKLHTPGKIAFVTSELYALIRELDDEFNHQCPHSRFVDDQCERCGKPDPLAEKEG